MSLYYNTRFGFSMRYPEAWIVREGRKSVILEAPRGYPSITVSIDPVTKGESIGAIKVVLRRIYGNRLKELRGVTIADMEGVEAIYLKPRYFFFGTDKWKHKMVVFLRGNQEYKISLGGTSTGEFDQYEAIFDECIQSIAFGEPLKLYRDPRFGISMLYPKT